MGFEITEIIALARRWWWLLLLGPMIGGLVSYGVSSRAAEVYSTSVLLQVNPPPSTNAFDSNSIQSSKALATSYNRLIETRSVLEPVVTQLSLPYGVKGLQDHVTSWTLPETSYVEISVTDGDPERVAVIANAVADSLAQHVTDQITRLSQPIQDSVNAQITDLDDQIKSIKAQIDAFEASGNATDAASLGQLNDLQSTLADLRQSRTELLRTKQSLDLNTIAAQNQITVTSPAEPATTPIDPKPRVASVLGAAFGLFVAAAAVATVGYMDMTVKFTTDFMEIFGIPLLGGIGHQRKLRRGPGQLFLLRSPHSAPAEAIRSLRTNLEYAAVSGTLTTMAITSPDSGDGKSTVAANLALATAKSGLRTVLVDANFRDPVQHRIFNTSNFVGLSTLLRGSESSWSDIATQTTVQNLKLLPSGPIPSNPADLLSLGRVRQMLMDVEAEADIILIDTPSALAYSDAQIIAAQVDAVMLVCRPERTRIDALRRVERTLATASARLVGIVLNRPGRRGYQLLGSPDGAPLPTSPKVVKSTRPRAVS